MSDDLYREIRRMNFILFIHSLSLLALAVTVIMLIVLAIL